MIKQFWSRLISQSWLLCTLLVMGLAIPRFIIMLHGYYNLVILIFLFMWAIPFVFLTREGRKNIGITTPKSYSFLFLSFLIGIIVSLLVYYIGYILYAHSSLHWFVVIMNTFNKGTMIQDTKSHVFIFLLISLPTMLFSPIGEEFLFRGFVQTTYSNRFGERTATFADAAFFGVTHLAHYGLILNGKNYSILPSAFVWIFLMMLVSIVFSFMRTKSHSIWGSVACHSGFNLGMMFCIFYIIN